MNNFNLKYLVIAAVLLSALMIIGALVIGFIKTRSEKAPVTTQTTNTVSPTPNPQDVQPAKAVEGGIGQPPLP